MGRQIALLGLLTVITGDAWGSPPQEHQSPAERAQRCLTFVHKDVRWVWPDGRDGTIAVDISTSPLKPIPFPPESEPNTDPLPLARAGLDAAVRRVTNLTVSREAIEASARGYDAFERKQYLQSEKEYSEAIRLEPTEPRHYCNRSIVRVVLGYKDGVIADCTRAIEVSGDSAEYHRRRAKAWYWLGQSDRALAEVNNAIRLDPNLTQAFCDRACYRVATGDNDGALADINQAIEIDRSFPAVLGLRFQFLILKRDVNGAFAATDDLIHSRSPAEQGTGGLMRMTLLSATGALDHALQVADALVSGDPNEGQLRVDRAKILIDKREYDRALADCDHALRLDPNLVGAYLLRALAWKGKREYRRALADFDAALRASPDNHDGDEASNHRAWLLATCPDATIRDGRTALEAARRCVNARKREDPHSLETLAAAEAETGDFASAVRTEQEALARAQGFGPKLIRDARKRLALYQAGRPFRDDEPEAP